MKKIKMKKPLNIDEIIDKHFKKEINEIIEYNINNNCINCNSSDIRFNNEFFVCVHCGVVDKSLFFCQQPLFEEGLLVKYSYMRLKHFKKILKSITGDRICRVPDDVIEDIKKHDFNNIFELKKLMKSLNYKKYYLSVYWIYKIIKNKNLINLSKNTINKMIIMFKEIDSCFIQLRQSYDEKRKNILHYQYLIRKMLLILDQGQHLEHLSKMKSVNKLNYSEKLFKQICDELGYKFIPETID
jgi:hypothetical protein